MGKHRCIYTMPKLPKTYTTNRAWEPCAPAWPSAAKKWSWLARLACLKSGRLLPEPTIKDFFWHGMIHAIHSFPWRASDLQSMTCDCAGWNSKLYKSCRACHHHRFDVGWIILYTILILDLFSSMQWQPLTHRPLTHIIHSPVLRKQGFWLEAT